MLLHNADAPCHGTQYHNTDVIAIPMETPLEYPMMAEVVRLDIQYWFGYISKSLTDQMINGVVWNDFFANRVKRNPWNTCMSIVTKYQIDNVTFTKDLVSATCLLPLRLTWKNSVQLPLSFHFVALLGPFLFCCYNPPSPILSPGQHQFTQYANVVYISWIGHTPHVGYTS